MRRRHARSTRVRIHSCPVAATSSGSTSAEPGSIGHACRARALPSEDPVVWDALPLVHRSTRQGRCRLSSFKIRLRTYAHALHDRQRTPHSVSAPRAHSRHVTAPNLCTRFIVPRAIDSIPLPRPHPSTQQPPPPTPLPPLSAWFIVSGLEPVTTPAAAAPSHQQTHTCWAAWTTSQAHTAALIIGWSRPPHSSSHRTHSGTRPT